MTRKVFYFLLAVVSICLKAQSLTINGVSVAGAGYIEKPFITGKIHFDGANTLTLEDASISTDGLNHGINTDIPNFKIILLGSNTITTRERVGIRIANATNNTITGGGRLEILNSATGIFISGTAALTIEGGVDLLAECFRYGITGMRRAGQTLTIDNARVRVKGESNGSIIDVVGLNLLGGTKIKEPAGAVFQSSAVYFDGMVCIEMVEIAPENLSVNEIQPNSNINQYPNPAINEIFVETSNATAGVIYILDASGKVVHSQAAEGKKTKINVSQLNKGIYFVKYGDKSSKFIKQ